jgi:hypothetical protein
MPRRPKKQVGFRTFYLAQGSVLSISSCRTRQTK